MELDRKQEIVMLNRRSRIAAAGVLGDALQLGRSGDGTRRADVVVG